MNKLSPDWGRAAPPGSDGVAEHVFGALGSAHNLLQVALELAAHVRLGDVFTAYTVFRWCDRPRGNVKGHGVVAVKYEMETKRESESDLQFTHFNDLYL